MGDIAQRGNKLTKGVKDLVTGSFKGAKKVAQGARDLITAPSKRIKQFGGGRTRLLEELGRVEAEPSNRNRRAEISRVHGELNRGYKHGGKTKTPQHYLVHGYGSTYKPKRTRKAIGGVVKGGRHIGKLLKKLGKEIKDQPLPPQLKGKAEELKKAFPHHDSKGRLKKAEGGRIGFKKGESASHKPKVVWKRPKDSGRRMPEGLRSKARIFRTHGRDVPTMAAEGGRIGLKKGGSDKNWIQKAVNPKHKGYCTPMTKKTCTPRRKALARTFKKKAKTGWS